MNPLKQGLKRTAKWSRAKETGIVKEVNPLKQGLKHRCVFSQLLLYRIC